MFTGSFIDHWVLKNFISFESLLIKGDAAETVAFLVLAILGQDPAGLLAGVAGPLPTVERLLSLRFLLVLHPLLLSWNLLIYLSNLLLLLLLWLLLVLIPLRVEVVDESVHSLLISLSQVSPGLSENVPHGECVRCEVKLPGRLGSLF